MLKPPALRRPASSIEQQSGESDLQFGPLTDAPTLERFWNEGLPSWLVSFVTHLLIILLLVLIPLHSEGMRLIQLSLGDGAVATEDSLDLTQDSFLEIEETFDIQTDATAMVQVEEAIEMDVKSLSTSEVPRAAIRQTLAGRTGSMKSTLLAAYGGTRETEDAVALGLKWLSRRQRSDGSWSLQGTYSNGGVQESRTAATAMAILAFLGAGHTTTQGEYQQEVARGVNFLMKSQKSNGFMADDAPGHYQMYAQAQATMVLCELYALEQDPRVRSSAELAVQFAQDAQSKLGGWRYQPKIDADLSVTGWFVLALMSARMGGLETSGEKLAEVSRFLDSVQSERGSLYAYKETEVDSPRPSMTAEGLLCRIFLGWPRYDDRLRMGVDALLQHPITADARKRNYYYWYYATQTMHHVGGEPWNTWNREMRRVLPSMQIKDGPEAGSWPPEGDPYGVSAGRLYATCLSIYCLEIYYRHLPIYDIQMLTGADDYIGIGQ